MKKHTINVKGAEITVLSQNQQDYISLTDMARNFEDGVVLIEKWLRNKNTIVRLDKMKAYNQVNLLNGYGILTIISPVEVVTDEEE